MHNDIREQIDVVNANIEYLKNNFLSIIKNTSLPLPERWVLFKKAPDYLKEHDSWVVCFNWESKYKKISWYDDFYKQRHATVHTTSVIDYMEEDVEHWNGQEAIDELKEEILQMNLGSFEYDW